MTTTLFWLDQANQSQLNPVYNFVCSLLRCFKFVCTCQQSSSTPYWILSKNLLLAESIRVNCYLIIHGKVKLYFVSNLRIAHRPLASPGYKILKLKETIKVYTPISKDVVGKNGKWQLSNGNCTTERNCGFHIWYANTMCSPRGAKLGSTTTATKPHKFAYLRLKNSIFARFARAFFIFWHFEDFLVLSMTWNYLFCSCVDKVSIWWQMFNFVLSQALVPI